MNSFGKILTEKYGDEVTLYAGSDSIGLPFTLDNDNHENFIDYLENFFKQNGMNVKKTTFFNGARNRTTDFENFFEMSKYKLDRSMQLYAKLLSVHPAFVKQWHPNFLKDYYNPIKEEKDIIVKTDFMNAERPIFIYSCGHMDINYNLGVNLGTPGFNFNRMAKGLFSIKDIIENTFKGIEDNIDALLKYNNNAEIFVLSGYNILNSKLTVKLTSKLFEYFDMRVEEICNKYDKVTFVDITEINDYIFQKGMHPSESGQKLIGKKLVKSITIK